jgi:transaldolase
VSAECVTEKFEEMVEEGRRLAKLAGNVVVKIPLTADGLKAVKALSSEGVKINVTLCFSASQALFAAKAGARFISPFVGRIDDTGHDGMQLIQDICTIYKNYNFTTEVLVASIRHPIHVLQAAKIGAHVSTMPFKVFEQLIKHPLTDIGVQRFLDDYKKIPK